jgi:hypothetical protein
MKRSHASATLKIAAGNPRLWELPVRDGSLNFIQRELVAGGGFEPPTKGL